MTRIAFDALAVVCIPFSTASAEKKPAKKKTHPGQAHIAKFVKLARAGKLMEAGELAKPKYPDLFARALKGLNVMTSGRKDKVAIHEIWASETTAWAAFPPTELAGLRGNILTIFARQSDGEWFVESFTTYRPKSWERDRKRYEREYKAKRIYIAKKKSAETR